MIPDKIYIPLYPNLDTDGFHLGDDWMETPDSYSKCKHVEYIRKDALLELIKDEAKFWDDGEMIFGQLLDKLNSV